MTCRIGYNSKTIDFTADIYRLQVDYPGAAMVNRSASGVVETLNVKAEVMVSLGFRNFVNANASDATQKRKLQQWFSWAREGNTWTFARDSAEVANTTLTAPNAAGDTIIHLTSSTGITAGNQYVIRSLTHLELVKVLTVDSAIQVTLTETLNYDYATGNRFRSEFYWPARLLSNANPLVEQPPLHYDFELSLSEDVNSL